jgi:carboxylesterase type B
MVFIYGGAFIIGSDATPIYDGTSLASSGNVIVVNLNYRLGALGFLVLDGITDSTNNNFGFRDQIQALQWVQANIASFGGDPANVTIFGESAGAMSVGLHALSSSQSSGLFKAAIMESNPLGIAYLTSEQAGSVGTAFAAGLSCMSNPASCGICDIVTRELQVATELLSPGLSSLPWAPVVDGTLITQQPMAAAEAGALKVPMLLGTNLNEGNVFAALVSAARTLELGRIVIQPADYSEILQNVFGPTNANAIQNQGAYACTQPLCGPTLARVINDYVFACANRHLAAQAQSGIYTYQFTQSSGTSCNPWPGLFAGCATQSCHGAEVPYVFDNPSGVVGGKCVFSAGEQALSSLMQSYWTSFARQQAPAGTPTWPSFKPNNTYMVLDTSSATAVDPWNSSSNCSFWDQIGYPPLPPAEAATKKR